MSAIYSFRAVLSTVIASASKVPSTSTFPLMSNEPKAPTPVVVILLEPVSIVPNPLVILHEFIAPVVTIFEPPTL